MQRICSARDVCRGRESLPVIRGGSLNYQTGSLGEAMATITEEICQDAICDGINPPGYTTSIQINAGK